LDRPASIDGGGERRLDVVEAAGITRQRQSVPAGAGHGVACCDRINIETRHPDAGRGEGAHACSTDPAADTGDERVLVGQPEVEHACVLGECSYRPEPGRFSERLASLSARFSLSDFPGFLLFDFFGDLSAM
jgi:hypothetical protein